MEKIKIDDLKAAIYWIAVNYQQNFYEVSSDWNKYNSNEHVYLKNYIGYALYGPPEFEKVCNDSEDGIYRYTEIDAMNVIESIYNKIVEHGTQLTDEKEVLCSILYTCIYNEESLKICDEYHLNELIFIRPVFKVQKCVKVKSNIDFQNWYIDTEARVYKNWNDFLKNNNMPTCTMISPKDGIYQADLKEIWSDSSSPVWVETHRNNVSKKFTNAVDVASTLVNFGCVGIGIASIFNPITAPIAIAGAVGGAVSGVWGGTRAVQELIDRSTHDQSISFINKHALPAWLGVAGSTLGLAASSGSALLSRAIRTGTSVGKGAQFAHDAIIVSNLFVNTVGVGYNSMNMVQKYRETGEVSAKDVFFLTAHVLFICNSAIKVKFASEIITSDQNQILKDYEDSLRSNRHRKEFRRLVRNTGANVADEVSRNEQIIRSLTKISNKDEFFATMVQNRKLFASTNTKLSFVDGQVQVNGVSLVSPSTFASMSKESIVSLINQATEVRQSTSSQSRSTSTLSTSKCSFVSANALKSGVASLRDFCIQKSMSVDSFSSANDDVMKDIQNLPEKSQIISLLMDSGFCILNKICNGNYTIDDALNDVTNFIWSLIKINFVNCLPGVNMFEEKYRYYLMKIIRATHDYIKANCGEWVNAFRSWRDLRFRNIDEEMEQSNPQPKSNDSRIIYNDVIMLDPMEIMALPRDVTAILVQNALISTGSNMNANKNTSKEMIKLCVVELNEFFLKHPISIDFKLTDLANDLKGILNDIQIFEKKAIIFYKLLVISMNIAQKVVENQVLKKHISVNVMKYLWILVNMNFHEIIPNTHMFDPTYEGFLMNIIIAIYRYQLAESDKWLRAFYEYTFKCLDQ